MVEMNYGKYLTSFIFDYLKSSCFSTNPYEAQDWSIDITKMQKVWLSAFNIIITLYERIQNTFSKLLSLKKSHHLAEIEKF